MPSLVSRLRTDLLARLQDLPSATGPPLGSRGFAVDETALPCAFVWIDSDSVESRAGGDVEVHEIAFVVGAMTKNTAAISTLDALVEEIRERMVPDFEGALDMRFLGVEYEDEVRTFARPFVSASLSFAMSFTTTEGDAE